MTDDATQKQLTPAEMANWIRDTFPNQEGFGVVTANIRWSLHAIADELDRLREYEWMYKELQK
jgi:hypothetical protein